MKNCEEIKNDISWFRVDFNTDSEQLFNFIMRYLPAQTTLELYRLIKKELGE